MHKILLRCTGVGGVKDKSNGPLIKNMLCCCAAASKNTMEVRWLSSFEISRIYLIIKMCSVVRWKSNIVIVNFLLVNKFYNFR